MKNTFYYYTSKIKVLKTIVITLMFMTIPVMATFADDPGEPCDQNDPIGICPLDTWVIFLVLIALLFTVLHLRNKQKSLQP